MWKDKEPKIWNIYFRLGNDINITTKGEFSSNIDHTHEDDQAPYKA